jgi:hypothetical protein
MPELNRALKRPTAGLRALRNRWFVGSVLLVCLVAPAVADSGTAVFVSGNVRVAQRSGHSTALAAGGKVASGDLLSVGTGARAQIRFVDGAYVSLLPGTELRVDTYRIGAAANGKEAAFFSLYRGSARFMAGTIGKAEGRRFRVTTPVAALEAHAGEFVAIVVKGLQVTVGAGSVSVFNDAGALTLSAGQRAIVADRGTAPYLVGTVVPERITP